MTTTLSDDALRAANLSLARTWMTTIGEPDWWNLISDEAVLEFPYGPSIGVAERIVGRAAVVTYVQSLLQRMGRFNFQDLKITATTDPATFYCEYYADLSTPQGEHYRQVYINKLRFENGKAVFMREFWDPKRIADSMTGALNLRS